MTSDIAGDFLDQKSVSLGYVKDSNMIGSYVLKGQVWEMRWDWWSETGLVVGEPCSKEWDPVQMIP